MSTTALVTHDVPRLSPASAHVGSYDEVLTELGSALLASLPRSDQRKKGMDYIQGLLRAKGRKSIRNIAAVAGGQATEQSLHHFVCDSTWDWTLVRRALAQYLARIAPPRAYVVRPMVIPKAGQHSVGVERRFFPALGQVLNAQQAMGVWAASEEMSAPINWRLQLSPAWADDELRRSQACIPDELGTESLSECAVEAYLEAAQRWKLPVRPVIMDTRETDAARVVRRLHMARRPVLLRVSSTLRLMVVDPSLPSRGPRTMPAHHIMTAARAMRRPVIWGHNESGSAARAGLVATVRVKVPLRHGRLTLDAAQSEMLLMGAGDNDRSWPSELWLTDLAPPQATGLLRLGGLVRRVEHDFAHITDQVGIRDYAGRSFRGWHRHVTLASIAHGVAALAGAARRDLSCAC